MVPKSTIERQPLVTFTQLGDPMYILLLLDIAIVVWVPSPMAMELVVVRVMPVTSTTSNVPVDPPGISRHIKIGALQQAYAGAANRDR